MPKQTAQLALLLPPKEPGVPAIRWLYAALQRGILDGRLRPGARLPATRDLAQHYGLSRGTIVAAFELLKAEGYLEASIGSGTYVTRVLPERLRPVQPASLPNVPAARSQPRRLADYGRRVRGLSIRQGPTRAFRTNQPALDLFPTVLWAQVTGRRLRRAPMRLFHECGPMGYPPLQQAVADYLITSRGVRCTPDQVMIVSGVQQALDLAARLFLNPGDRAAMESPGYIGAVRVFEAHGARIAHARVEDEGMTLTAAALKGARLVYVTPAHQFPLGVSMSLPRRLALLEWAQHSGALIFEDDYDSEYRYSGRPLPALQGLDSHGQVLFSGSFSKTLFPALRLAYLVVPADLIDRFAAVQSITNRHAPLLDQAVLADFIAAGHFGRHLRRMREVYAERLSVLLESARAQLGGLLEISGVEAGLQTVGWMQGRGDADVAATRAAEREVEVTPLSRHTGGSAPKNGLLLGFAAVDADEIRRGVRELASVLQRRR